MEPSTDGLRLAGPSREIPFSARVQFLFGGFYNQFGWMWFGFTMIHFRAFILHPHAGQAPWPALLVPLLFPLIGLTFMAIGLKKGLHGIRLLRRGVTGTGRLVSKKATNTQINHQTVYELTFEFTTAWGQKAKATARTHETGRLEDEAEEPLVYDPGDPSGAVMLDDLPGRPRLDDLGVTRSRDAAWLHYLIVPGISVTGHLAWLILFGP